MADLSRTRIDWAPREKKRTVNRAVGKNFFKTITEPITNSDSKVKDKANVAHASGLVEKLLALKANDRVDTSALKAQLPKKHRGQIVVEITTFGKDARVCSITDDGPGMTAAELHDKFGSYAKAKKMKRHGVFSVAGLLTYFYTTKTQ